MKLLYAYTIEAYAGSGFTIPNGFTQDLGRVGSTPFIQFQTASSSVYTAGGGWMAVNTGFALIRAQLFNALLNSKAGEIITVGHRLMRGGVSWPNNTASMMTLQSTSLVTWREFSTGAGAKSDVFLEVSIDTTLNKAITYLDGRKIAEVPITAKVNLGNVAVGISELSSQSTLVYIRDLYAAIFEPADGIIRLTSWACEDLVQTSSELPANRTVLDKPLVVEFTPPAKDTLIVGADVQANNPQLYSALNVEISDGVAKNSASVVDILQDYTTSSMAVTTNSGRPTASLKPANGAAKISLTLKATVK